MGGFRRQQRLLVTPIHETCGSVELEGMESEDRHFLHARLPTRISV